MVVIPKRRTGSIVAFFGKLYISCLFLCKPIKGVGIQNGRYCRIANISSMYITLEASCVFILNVYHLRIKLTGFCKRRQSMLAQYILHVYLIVNPKRELEFKMVVIVGLQDNSSMYITLETSHVFISSVYYLRIKLIGFCQHRPL